jgi:hypothetical protein
MEAIDHILLGVGLIGMGMTAKVVRDGLRHLGYLHEKMVVLRKATLGTLAKTEQGHRQLIVAENKIEDMTTDVKVLEGKLERATRKTELLKTKFGNPASTRHKLELQEQPKTAIRSCEDR